MKFLLLVGIGGSLGAVTRYILIKALENFSKQIPLGTMLCNIIGSLIIGILAAFLIKNNSIDKNLSLYIQSILITGFLGGFTTFSTFSLDILNLLLKGEIFITILYTFCSIILSLICVLLGFYSMKKFFYII